MGKKYPDMKTVGFHLDGKDYEIIMVE